MEFPIDILREISLYLPYNFLALSKELNNIYDETWFKYKLKYSVNKTKFSFKDLYTRSLKSGLICKYNKNCNNFDYHIEGIKISIGNPNFRMILTYDGDLWGLTKSHRHASLLIDTNVVDINDKCYIKENEWYRVYQENNINKNSLIIKIETNFIAICNYGNYLCAITKDKLYCFNINSEKLTSIDCQNNKNISNISNSEYFMIQDTNGFVKMYYAFSDTLSDIIMDNVISIYPYSAKLLNNSLIYIKYNNNILNHDIIYDNNILTTEIILDNCDGLIKCVPMGNKFMLLINGNVYDYNNCLICENVKNIFSWSQGQYFVMNS
jgi:hypothetical protein